MNNSQLNRVEYLTTTLFNVMLGIFFNYVASPFTILPVILQSYASVKRCRNINFRPYFPLFFLFGAYILKIYLLIKGINPPVFFSEMRRLEHFTPEQNTIALMITIRYLSNIINLIYFFIFIFKKGKNQKLNKKEKIDENEIPAKS